MLKIYRPLLALSYDLSVQQEKSVKIITKKKN